MQCRCVMFCVGERGLKSCSIHLIVVTLAGSGLLISLAAAAIEASFFSYNGFRYGSQSLMRASATLQRQKKTVSMGVHLCKAMCGEQTMGGRADVGIAANVESG